MSVLSIQSRVASGYVGNSIAIPCLQQLGHEAISIDTALLSNHPAHGQFRGRVFTPEEVRELLTGVIEMRGFEGIEAALSGYLGAPENGATLAELVPRARSQSPDMLYCLDPVMGDNGAVYVDSGLVSYFREIALPLADMVVPNAFEAGLLLEQPPVEYTTAPDALDELLARGPRYVVITGVPSSQGVATFAATETQKWKIETDQVTVRDSGAGDAFAALLTGHIITPAVPFSDAVSRAVNSVYDLLTLTKSRRHNDLAYVEGIDFIRKPKSRFEIHTI